MDFDELEEASPKQLHDWLWDWEHCKTLQADNPSRFLALVDLTLTRGAHSVAFQSLLPASKAVVLASVAKKTYPEEAALEIVRDAIDGLVRPHPGNPWSCDLTAPTVEAWESLPACAQDRVRHDVARKVSWKTSLNDHARHNEMADIHYGRAARVEDLSPRDHLMSPKVIECLSRTVRFVRLPIVAPGQTALNEVARKLGTACPPAFDLTLDFETRPRGGARFSSGQGQVGTLPDGSSEDPVPPLPGEDSDADQRSNDQPRSQADRPVVQVPDYLGLFVSHPSPHIVLRVARIADCARGMAHELTVQDCPGLLWAIVLIHEFAHLVHLAEPDADGRYSTVADSDFVELVAQLVSWNVVRETRAEPVFLWLSRHQSPRYQSWQHVQTAPMEAFRGFLSDLRTRQQPSTYNEARQRFTALP